MFMVFLLNGFGIIDPAIPAKEMMERGAPAALVPLAMLAGRLLEVIAAVGLALGLYPRMVRAGIACLPRARHFRLSFVLARRRHASVSRTTY